jgi:hypothetical protein
LDKTLDILNALANEKSLKFEDVVGAFKVAIFHKFLSKADNAFAGKPLLQITPKNGNYLVVTLPKEKKEIIYKNKTYPLISLDTTINGIDPRSSQAGQKGLGL